MAKNEDKNQKGRPSTDKLPIELDPGYEEPRKDIITEPGEPPIVNPPKGNPPTSNYNTRKPFLCRLLSLIGGKCCKCTCKK